MPADAERFGQGKSGLVEKEVLERAEVFSWVEFAVRVVGPNNGDPRVKSAMRGRMERGRMTPERAAKLYCRSKIPQNFWWGHIVELAERENEDLARALQLAGELVDGCEYDRACVPDGYPEVPVRGLAMQRAREIIERIGALTRMQSEERLFAVMDVIGRGVKELKTFDGFYRRMVRELGQDW